MHQFWQDTLLELKHDVSEAEYQQWLLPVTAEISGDTLILNAINAYFIKHIEKNYLEKIKKLVSKHSLGEISQVSVQLKNQGILTPKQNNKKSLLVAESNTLNELYTFEAFVRGKSNTLAYNACWDMVKHSKVGGCHSLFLYGYSGLGKTHLMHSVAHRYQKNGLKVCYFSSDSFMQKVARAFMENRIGDFQKSVATAQLLIVDDVHLIQSSKKPTIAGVLLTLHSQFLEQDKQVILASDKPPMQMEGFDQRFLSRFSTGLTVAIDPPERETRVQILEKKAQGLQLTLPKECAIFIAENIPPDVRRLEGALLQVQANAQMLGLPVDITLVRQALKSHVVSHKRALDVQGIKGVVAEYYGVSVKELVGKKRTRNIARPRQMAMALARKFTSDSLIDIGQAFGGRDHSTVIHACDKVAELCQADSNVERDFRTLSATLEFL